MDAHDIERVIESELELEVDRESADHASKRTQHERPARREERTGGGDCHKAGDSARCGTHRGRLSVFDLLDNEHRSRWAIVIKPITSTLPITASQASGWAQCVRPAGRSGSAI